MSTPPSAAGVDIEALFESIDRFDAGSFATFFAPDATYVFANYPATQGRDEIVSGAAAFWKTLASVQHDLLDVFPFDGGFVSRLEIRFDLKNGQSVTLPAATITRAAKGLISDHRVYMNETPLAGGAG